MGIVISIYLVIGAIYSLYTYFTLDRMIGDYEEGKELGSDDRSRLKDIEEQVGVMGGKLYVALMFVVVTAFWLPMVVVNPPTRN